MIPWQLLDFKVDPSLSEIFPSLSLAVMLQLLSVPRAQHVTQANFNGTIADTLHSIGVDNPWSGT